jgi:predicted aminopeptidase
VTWSFLAVGAAGVLIGARFRVSTLLAVSFAIIVAGVTAMQFLGFSDKHTFLTTLYLVLTLQGTHLAGLLFAILLHRSAFDRRLR